MPTVCSSALGPLRAGAGAFMRGVVATLEGGLASWLQAANQPQQQIAAIAAYLVLIMSPAIPTIITISESDLNPSFIKT